MPFTDKGLVAKKFSEIVPEINQELIDLLGTDIDTTPDTVLGVLINIFSSEISSQEALTQAMTDNFDLDKAEGVYLDRLAAFNSIKRLRDSATTGSLWVKVSQDGSLIPAGSIFRDNQSNNYNIINATQINSSTCTSCKFRSSGNVGTFTISINGVSFSEVYTSIPTQEQVAQDLEFLINQTSPTDYTVTREGGEVEITILNKFSDLNITRNENMEFSEVEGRISVIAQETGPLNPPIGTVRSSASSIPNLVSLTNYDIFTVGRSVETDRQLRLRIQNSAQIARNSTNKAIFTRLSDISGVSLVRVFENTSNVPDSDGRPPHSYECIVEGGNEQEIAQQIYDSKPSAVRTYGSQEYIVEDYVGQPASVFWSRPIAKYINVRVGYTRYLEEEFPDDAVDAIKQAIVDFGNSLSLDTDIIPKRLYGAIYNAVEGIEDLTVEVGSSFSPSTTIPDETPYTTGTIPISKREKANFNLIRIEVSEL